MKMVVAQMYNCIRMEFRKCFHSHNFIISMATCVLLALSSASYCCQGYLNIHDALDQYCFENERLREIAATDETLRALLGDGVYWLRPPWGFLAPQTAAAVEVPMVYWSLDTEDWRRLDADAVAQDIIDHARDGDIILLHDPYATSVEAALRAIDALTPQGYRFVTLEELFRQKGVEPEPGKLYIRPDELKRIA